MNDGKRVHHDLQYENIPFSHMSIDLHLLKAPYQKKDKGRAKITAFTACYLASYFECVEAATDELRSNVHERHL